MNIVIISGNLANEPEAYTTQNGVSRSMFRVAVQRRFANAQGQREADFLTVVAWKNNAEFCNKYLHKGSRVAVEGNIQTRSYDAQDGSKRWVTEIVADHVESLDKRENGGERPATNRPARQQNNPEPQGNDFQEVDPGDELPF